VLAVSARSSSRKSAAGTRKTKNAQSSATPVSPGDGSTGCALRERLRKAITTDDTIDPEDVVELIAREIERAKGASMRSII